jgi:NAD(P)-dependent dehydrogenase (short-subunit alcohol dehydrogenase family)
MENEDTTRVVAITGASNGMGLEAAKLFAKKGWIVYAGARRVEKIPTDEGIIALALDVTNSSSKRAFVDRILAEQGQVDVLVNNAGYGEYGPAEEIPMENVRKQFETNFFGAVELTQLVLPTMRSRGYGRIVNISSIGGYVYTPLGAFYHATKAAMQQWSDVLDTEVAQFGIRSVCVNPGNTKSAWGSIALETVEKNLLPDSPYASLVDKVRKGFSHMEKAGTTSADLAKDFYKAATAVKPELRYYHSVGDRAMVRLAKTHPKLWRRGINLLLKHL